MKRLLLLTILICMTITIQAANHHAMGNRYDILETYPPIDSIVLIMDCPETRLIYTKFTITPIHGFFEPIDDYDSRGPQRLCEWQRKEIYEALLNIFITKTMVVIKDRISMPPNYQVSADPTTMHVTFFSGNQSRKEKLTLYYLYNYHNKCEKYIYTDEFKRFISLIYAIERAYLSGSPWVC